MRERRRAAQVKIIIGKDRKPVMLRRSKAVKRNSSQLAGYNRTKRSRRLLRCPKFRVLYKNLEEGKEGNNGQLECVLRAQRKLQRIEQLERKENPRENEKQKKPGKIKCSLLRKPCQFMQFSPIAGDNFMEAFVAPVPKLPKLNLNSDKEIVIEEGKPEAATSFREKEEKVESPMGVTSMTQKSPRTPERRLPLNVVSPTGFGSFGGFGNMTEENLPAIDSLIGMLGC
eukprot:CAMPEP_0167773124 /NCGR_PEP_ID=MMETSP0111_2-20121227/1242_1 /TAXON_ID=91324 /ORGANISM="Lotharella globosa, Strain CCCM811" /LENGTH=227 /DNA_ID=CAMNT_0007662719 /DNA_START=63 /DNA_END=746 /DNA_ORIENTATION=+